MKYAAFLFGAVLALLSASTQATTLPQQHAAFHSLTTQWVEDGHHWTGYCGSYAVGPHLVLTALHCTEHYYQDGIIVDGKEAHLVKMWINDNDQALIRVNRTFKTWAKIARTKPQVGERIHWWGDPAGVVDVYREGYITSVLPKDTETEDGRVLPGGSLILDANSWYGDSGSAVLNADGEVVATINQFRSLDWHNDSLNFKLMVAHPLGFPASVWKDALG